MRHTGTHEYDVNELWRHGIGLLFVKYKIRKRLCIFVFETLKND